MKNNTLLNSNQKFSTILSSGLSHFKFPCVVCCSTKHTISPLNLLDGFVRGLEK